MAKTVFNEQIDNMLNHIKPISPESNEEIQKIINGKDIFNAIIDEKWLEDQYIGDGKEYKHPKYGTVTITVEVNLLDIIEGNALVENKRIYTGKYSGETNETTMYFFGPIDKELLEQLNEE